jgi:hypothetical protein
MIRLEGGGYPKGATRPLQVRWTGAGKLAEHPVAQKPHNERYRLF